MDVHAKLDELTALIENARSMPMSASCVVNRGEVLGAIDEVRAGLPGAISEANQVIAEKNSVIDEGRAEADRIIEAAKSERSRLVARAEVMREASREAELVLESARSDADRMRHEIDDYVDGKLANFEVVLHKTLKAVEKGRAKISGRHELDDLAPEEQLLPE